MTEPLVSVHMITYNHGPYIAAAIEGVLEQKTHFPFELVIGEDCSTDGTRESVFEYHRKYPDIIRVITSDHNVGAKRNGERTSKACRGKYVAFCDGDDYWIDPRKLQAQAEFLEGDSDYGLVHTNFVVLDTAAGIMQKPHYRPKMIPQGNVYEELLCENFIATVTVMARGSLVTCAGGVLRDRNWLMADYPLWLEIARCSKVRYLDVETGVYRVLKHSASHSPDPIKNSYFSNSVFDIASHFMDKYGCSEGNKEKSRVIYYSRLLRSGFLINDYELARTGGEFLRKTKGRLSLKTQCLIPLSGNRAVFILGRMLYAVYRFLAPKLVILHYHARNRIHGKPQ
jgi:glycosyltransferase involved in cell wall biosynthesis